MRPTITNRYRRALPALFLLAALAAQTLPVPARADPLPALKAARDDPQTPGDPAWPLGQRAEHGVGVIVSTETDPGAENGRAFRIALAPPSSAPRPDAAAHPRACAGLTSGLRRNLHATRAVTLEIRADRPLAGIIVMTSSDTERPNRRDRSFGTFVITRQWRALRLVYGDLAPLPGWPAEAARLGFAPSDLVLRPDSTEDICIGVETDKIPAGGAAIEIRDLRFVR